MNGDRFELPHESNKNVNPGPGHYAETSLERSTAYKMGTSPKFNYKDSKDPGPGAYNPTKDSVLPTNSASGFGRSQRNYDKYHETGTSSNTGPGAYDIKLGNG